MPRLRPTVIAASLLLTPACKATVGNPPGAAMTWEQMNFQERRAHMTRVVLPQMKAVFQAHDPERFANFGCQTCHGQGSADGSFAMPNPDLMQFPRRGFKQEVYVPHREMVRFMWGEVQPKMAELLGMRESKYGRGAGFSCRNCHVRKDS
ncbi:MAG: hypothetical protein KC636_31820 [Myxococcales bacterium]|nr:hypothetical protein [Myxococcales bacterium]